MTALAYIVPMPHGRIRYSQLFAPLLKRKSLAVERVKSSGSTVSHLIRRRSPNTVPGLVIAIVINSLDAFPWGRLSHIGEKILKRLPALANFDPSTSVVAKHWSVLVLTPLPHAGPNVVGRSVRHAMPHGWSFIPKTAARLRPAIPNIGAIANDYRSTFASEPPHGTAAAPATSPFDSGETSKSLSSKIAHSHGCNSAMKRCSTQENLCRRLEAPSGTASQMHGSAVIAVLRILKG